MPDPIAFRIFGLEIRWYGVIIAAAIVLGMIIALNRAKKRGMDTDVVLDVLLLAIPLAIIGARAAYVFSHFEYYGQNPLSIFAFREGGLAIHGGIAGGIAGIIIMCKIKKQNAWIVADLVAPSLILGQAIGRWGNYFNMEVYGTQTTLPWAISVADPALGIIQVHPLFLYESLWNSAGFVLLLCYDKYLKKNNGETICLYLVFYSIGRFMIEFLRTDHVYIFSTISLAQFISALLAIVGAAILIFIRRRTVQEK